MAEELIRIDLNPNLERDLNKLKAVDDKVQAAARAIAERARQLAPVDTGEYRDKITVQKSNKSNSGIWRVISTAQEAFWVEFGVPSRGIHGQFVFRRAVESLGLKWAKRKK